jgi:hypothetical protein
MISLYLKCTWNLVVVVIEVTLNLILKTFHLKNILIQQLKKYASSAQ